MGRVGLNAFLPNTRPIEMEPEVVADCVCPLGEGPLWHPVERQLYWLDFVLGELYRYDPVSGRHERFRDAPRVAGFTFQADGAPLLLMGPTVAVLRNGALDYIIEGLPDQRDVHFNDAIADPVGRVFTGTVLDDQTRASDRLGMLYRLDTDGTITPMLDGIGISNGLGFTPDAKQLYYTDSYAQKIYLFDYDVQTGDLSNRRVFVETPPEGGLPDGMTVDAEGYVWSARWDGWALHRYAPDGTEERCIRFPAKKVSSVTFGGDGYTQIYVTTAGGDDRAEEGELAGALFRLDLGIKGRPEYPSRIGL